MAEGKLSILEKVAKKEISLEEVFKSLQEKEILKYFNDMAIKNIDKKEDLKRQNDILFEQLIIIGRELQRQKNEAG
jgi:hypothetical protein